MGKTTLADALARTFDCSFRRIQFTSDLLPSDILGVSIFNQAEQTFEFRRGPIFANLVLADEINRTTPKTQSALLEAMNEGKVSVDNQTYPLPRPFMVVATQNPIQYGRTFPFGVPSRPFSAQNPDGVPRGRCQKADRGAGMSGPALTISNPSSVRRTSSKPRQQ